ncbi:MAG: tRNA pseudouridine(38-40) synthase TruA [Pseudomonadota bacterium]
MAHRTKITIEYDGGPFQGWQRQNDQPTVQYAIETALHSLTGETVTIRGAGRTDAGVHALGQVAHFDTERIWDPDRIRDGLNYHLKPNPIAILDADPVDATFDARFSAIMRHYRYVILNRRARPALDFGRVWHVPTALAVDDMEQAAKAFIGNHDFTTFRAANCQAKSPIKTVSQVTVTKQDDWIDIRVSARSFLYNQVRSMVGSLVEVGRGRWPVTGIADALAAKDRRACGPVAPPHGLTLTAVDYE